MRTIIHYGEMLDLEGAEGMEILVLHSRLIYRRVRRKWRVVGKIDREGRLMYLEQIDLAADGQGTAPS